MSSRRSPGRAISWIGAALCAWLLLLGPPSAAGEPRIVVLGDSLTAGFGLPREDAFPAGLEAALRAEGHAWQVIDAGVSGDTSAGGLARLDWVLADSPEIVIVELGANDGLRGLPTDQMEANLDAILVGIGESSATTLLAGMRAPANFGADYAAAFRAVYERLAARHRVALYPFFLEGVALKPALNQPDGIHPNAAGVAEIVRRILPHVVALTARHKGGQGEGK
ncbi:MAG: arylesterase [Rhodospirillales bacterium]|nr:arylesterase [Rhodospirillales bacterium]MDE0379024.1 arylesterase [Rhodospirillales bacterium]